MRGVRYEDLTAVLASVVRDHQEKLDELIASTSVPWFVAAVGKAIAALFDLTARHITVTNDLDVKGAVHAQALCAGSTCVTEGELQALLRQAGQASVSVSTSAAASSTPANDNVPSAKPAGHLVK